MPAYVKQLYKSQLHPPRSCIHATKWACQSALCPGSNCPLSNQYAADCILEGFARGCRAEDREEDGIAERSDPDCHEHPYEGLWGWTVRITRLW